MTEFRDPTTQQWQKVNPFVYADGSTSPPQLLRNPADQNYLSKGARAVGFSLAGIAYFCVLSSLLWLFAYRHHTVVIASQPFFLMMMCISCNFITTAIVISGFDESYGWSEQQLTSACIAVPWLVPIGVIVPYNCLFCKVRTSLLLDLSYLSRRRTNIYLIYLGITAVESQPSAAIYFSPKSRNSARCVAWIVAGIRRFDTVVGMDSNHRERLAS